MRILSFAVIAAGLLALNPVLAADYTLSVNTALTTTDPLYKGLESFRDAVAAGCDADDGAHNEARAGVSASARSSAMKLEPQSRAASAWSQTPAAAASISGHA